MVIYKASFIHRLSEYTVNPRDLMKKGNEYTWTNSHERAFQITKALNSKEISLTYFDPTKTTTIQVDASRRGLGAALLQNDRPVAFESKSLTSTTLNVGSGVLQRFHRTLRLTINYWK